MTNLISQGGILPVKDGDVGKRLPPIVDLTGRPVIRTAPRLLPMRTILLSGTTAETEITPATLFLMAIDDSSSSAPAIGATVSCAGSGADGIVLDVIPASNGGASGLLIEETTPGWVTGEAIADGGSFTGSVGTITTNVRPCVVAITAYNIHATTDTEVRLRNEPAGAEEVRLWLLGEGRDQWLTEWIGKAGQAFTAQCTVSVVSVRLNVAWYVEIVS